MTDLDLCYMPASEALRLFRKKKLSPVELMEATIRRAEATQPVTYQWYLSSLPNSLGTPVGTTDRLTITAPAGYRGVLYLRCIASAGSCSSTMSRVFSVVSALADVNGDGFVDGFDFDAFVTAFEAGGAAADFNRDGFVDFFDYDAFLAGFEQGC